MAKNRTNLLARYPGLNPNVVVDDYGGELANGVERVALGMPEYSFVTNGPFITTNVFYIAINEVTYGGVADAASSANNPFTQQLIQPSLGPE